MVVVASIATTLFLGGWLRPFAGTSLFNFIDYFPLVLMVWVAGYGFRRTTKQPVLVQKVFMAAVVVLCIVLAAVVTAPALAPPGSLLAASQPRIHRADCVPFHAGAYLYL